MFHLSAVALHLLPLVAAVHQWYDIDKQPPESWEIGQVGHNACGTDDSQDSMCQTVMVNTVEDFCLWAPHTPNRTIDESATEEVAWCTASGHGARIMPEGTIQSAHMLVTPHYTQITGKGDFTKINIAAGDKGGQLNTMGVDGTGAPRGGLVYMNGLQVHNWIAIISDTEFCIRLCPWATHFPWEWCPEIYTLEDCAWNQPGNYDDGFDTCQGDGTDLRPGDYLDGNGGTSTYYESQGAAPTAHAAGASSNCQAVATVGGQGAPNTPPASTATPATSTSIASTNSSIVSPYTTGANFSSTSTSTSAITSSSLASNTSSVATSTTLSVPASTISNSLALQAAEPTKEASGAVRVSTGLGLIAVSLLGGVILTA
ncbi:uncharacterized protein JCM15063_001262 [Sporobolomyces koalae]|uniref:uncharacterized protein n=1 Tax=Sporobolomyces koalae TaxID=500713 RepID=UPI00317D292B